MTLAISNFLASATPPLFHAGSVYEDVPDNVLNEWKRLKDDLAAGYWSASSVRDLRNLQSALERDAAEMDRLIDEMRNLDEDDNAAEYYRVSNRIDHLDLKWGERVGRYFDDLKQLSQILREDISHDEEIERKLADLESQYPDLEHHFY